MTLLRKTPMKRSPLRPKKPLSRKKPSLAEVTERFNIVTAALLGPPKRKPMKKVRKPSGQKQVFERIWNSRPHKCEVCDATILQPAPWNFSHLLPKGAYPEYKLDERNVVLKCKGCHDKWHSMGPKNLIPLKQWMMVCAKYFKLKREANGIIEG